MTSPDNPHRTTPRSLRRLLAIAGLAALAFLPACKKEEPPPPPPPPPPPIVVPDPVDIQAIRQEVGADARVQIARGVETTERDIAEAVVRFADAWAKGDASAIRAMLSRPDRAILDDLRARGEWESEVKAIEQVRIVYLNQDGINPTGGDVNVEEMLSDDSKFLDFFMDTETSKAFLPVLEALFKSVGDLDPSVREQIATGAMLGQDSQETLRQFLSTPQGEQLKEQITSMIAAARQSVDGPVVTLALQQPGGSYVLAWNLQGAPGNYTFASLHTVDAVRRRASEWDGQAGLAGMVMPDAPEAAEGEDGQAQAQPEEGAEDEPFGTPGRKATPAGPVTIPGGGS